MSFSAEDHRYMAQALRIARQGVYTTDPNPSVGCVLVVGGEIIGEGWHERAGQLHAEPLALKEAGSRAVGATAYVTLEPCSHHGRTPPCADQLITAGVSRVVYTMKIRTLLCVVLALSGYAKRVSRWLADCWRRKRRN